MKQVKLLNPLMSRNLLIKSVRLNLIPFCLLIITACDGSSKTEKQLDQVADRISKEIVSKTSGLQELIPSSNELKKSSSEEIEKTFAIEYQVVEIKAGATTEEIQKKLSELGRDRWDCFSMTPEATGYRLLCKRRPHSALRAILGAGGIQ